MVNHSKKNGFIANTLRLVYGNAGAQAINLLTIPVITRFYTPESYGTLSLFLSASMIIIAVANLRLQTVILLPEKIEDAFSVFFLCIFFACIFAVLTAAIGLTVNYTSIQLPESYEVLSPYLYLMALYIFLAGSYKALGFIAVRQNQFTLQAIARVSNTGLNRLYAIGYGFLLVEHPVGLIGGLIAGQLISIVLVIKYSLSSFFPLLASLKTRVLIRTLKRYKAFVIYSGTAIIESFSREIVPLMFGALFGPAVLGYVGLSQRTIQQPLGTLGDAISRSFFQKITEGHRSGKTYSNHTFELFRLLLLVSFVPVLLIAIVSPEIFEVIFGPQWYMAGIYFTVLSFSFLSGFLYRPFSIIFDTQEKQRLRFLLNLCKIIFSALAIMVMVYYFNSPVSAIIGYSLVNTVFTFGIIILLIHMSGNAYRPIFAEMGRQLIVGVVFALPLVCFKYYVRQYYSWSAIIMAVLCVASYYLMIFYKEPRLKSRLLPLISKNGKH